ncbi:sugar phosphate isomerase/epimerase family protein [Croceiramulus getboli]|nr:sugar phosphate isomerase/epimerase [Flavobacteriaceae bacterium YJPT1-3]
MKRLSLIPFILVTLFTTTLFSCDSQEPLPEPGLALYTLRDAMGENPKATLEQVAAIGYVNLENAGYNEGTFYGMSPKDFKAFVQEQGLIPKSSHNSTVTLENADAIMSDVQAAGFEYFVVPIPPMGMFTYDVATASMGMKGNLEDFADILNTLGKKAAEHGLQLLYHNHDFEFKENADGVIPIDYLLKNTNPEYVNFQMDLYWVTKAKADPIAYFKEYPGRWKSWHVKDMDDQGRFAPVGQGSIDFARILEHREQAGMDYYLVEQDQTFDQKPMKAIEISFQGLKDLGFR